MVLGGSVHDCLAYPPRQSIWQWVCVGKDASYLMEDKKQMESSTVRPYWPVSSS